MNHAQINAPEVKNYLVDFIDEGGKLAYLFLQLSPEHAAIIRGLEAAARKRAFAEYGDILMYGLGTPDVRTLRYIESCYGPVERM